jgi:hypothetical protein
VLALRGGTGEGELVGPLAVFGAARFDVALELELDENAGGSS